MQTLRDYDLNSFYRNSIGVDKLFETLQSHTNSNHGGFPPYDVIATSEDNYVIKLAVAGFTEDDVNITAHDGQLIIKGETAKQDDDNNNYLHKGISNRKFKREFTLSDYVEVTDATLKDGILEVSLERQVPESMKPREISINTLDAS